MCSVEIHDTMDIKRSWGLKPPPLGIPRLAMLLYYLHPEMLPIPVIPRHRLRPRPLGGRAGVRGEAYLKKKDFYRAEKCKNNWFRAVVFGLLLFLLFSYIKNQITILPYEPISISLTAIVSSILIVLLLQCLRLMYRDMTSEKCVIPIDTTIVKSERKTDALTVEDHTEHQTKGSIRNLNEGSLTGRKFLFAIALIIFGIALNFIFILVYGDKSSLYLPFGYGVYFLGLTLIVNSWFSQKEEVISLKLKIEELSKKIDDMKE